MKRIAFFATLALTAGLAVTSPAQAQNDSGERINQLIIYGNDPCPQSTRDDEITVCARKDEAERFRIPEPLRGSESPQNDAWNNRVIAYETVGKQGVLSCSPVGPGGSTGCVSQLIDKAYAEKGSSANVKFSELIAAERAKRLSTIDAEAAETQVRVEQAEKEYEARQRAREEAQQQAGAGGSQPQGQ